MARISCTVTNCFYNERQGCTAPTLKVDGKKAFESRSTCCDTFVEQKPGIKSSVGDPYKNMEIKCGAVKCEYNKDEKCEATNVLVNGKNAKVPEETCCSTFKYFLEDDKR
ncbi:DUF1540 domain-containing protein [Sedimentibacter sp. MB31-C6]|uniref:DUF1540 domain-containing protein n=1 Tax=Sedimentibacter sp. MB31-C6 TaxID=3109366 RepID=UPI002DDCEFD2|nr:DUF1540 domain-containing protein [Sedimentibacter sp. MB36-C1]WSI05371.1 DUF1540 domain-containing protein [Sedimentibacter sp. MB36-C1]